MATDLDSPPARCAAFRDRASDWLDAELDASAAEAMDAHLRSCAACRRFACELEATVLALRSLGLPCCDG